MLFYSALAKSILIIVDVPLSSGVPLLYFCFPLFMSLYVIVASNEALLGRKKTLCEDLLIISMSSGGSTKGDSLNLTSLDFITIQV